MKQFSFAVLIGMRVFYTQFGSWSKLSSVDSTVNLSPVTIRILMLRIHKRNSPKFLVTVQPYTGRAR